jgi:hypothetical protein
MAIIGFADADKRRRKKQMQENLHMFLLTYAKRLTAAPVTVTHNDNGKRESYYGRY